MGAGCIHWREMAGYDRTSGHEIMGYDCALAYIYKMQADTTRFIIALAASFDRHAQKLDQRLGDLTRENRALAEAALIIGRNISIGRDDVLDLAQSGAAPLIESEASQP